MELEVGKIYEGKVTGITNFGAFVEIEKGTTGMVHISEIANTFVSQIKDFLTEGQTVKVKVLSLDNNKISLSIKQTLPQPEKKQRSGGNRRQGDHNQKKNNNGNNGGRQHSSGGNKQRKSYSSAPVQDFTKTAPPELDVHTSSGDENFEDMLSKFKATSEERFSDLKHVMDNKRKGSSRRR